VLPYGNLTSDPAQRKVDLENAGTETGRDVGKQVGVLIMVLPLVFRYQIV